MGPTGNPTIPNMKLTPCRLRLLATKVAPSTSLMSSLLSECGRRLHDICLDLVLDPSGLTVTVEPAMQVDQLSAALSDPNRARPRASIDAADFGFRHRRHRQHRRHRR